MAIKITQHRNSEQISALRADLGIEGYGIYVMLLECLSEAPEYSLPANYNALAFELRTTAQAIRCVVEDYDLFVIPENGDCFYCDDLSRDLAHKKEVSDKRKKAISARWERYNCTQKPIQMYQKSDTNVCDDGYNCIDNLIQMYQESDTFVSKSGYKCIETPIQMYSTEQRKERKQERKKEPKKERIKERKEGDNTHTRESDDFSGVDVPDIEESSNYDHTEEKEKVAQKRKSIDLSDVDPAFLPVVTDWLAYKAERKQTYKPLGFKVFYNHLWKYSGGSAETARSIIEQSMANNWTGIFALRNNYHNGRTTNKPPSDYELAQAVAYGIARANTRQEWE